MANLILTAVKASNERVMLFQFKKVISNTAVVMINNPTKNEKLRKTLGVLGYEIATRLLSSFPIDHISITKHFLQISLKEDTSWDELEPKVKSILLEIIAAHDNS